MGATESVNEATKRLYVAEGEIKAHIAKFGDELAKKHGYKTLSGIDGVYRYLVDKYHWLPHEVRMLSVEDLQLLLAGMDDHQAGLAR